MPPGSRSGQSEQTPLQFSLPSPLYSWHASITPPNNTPKSKMRKDLHNLVNGLLTAPLQRSVRELLQLSKSTKRAKSALRKRCCPRETLWAPTSHELPGLHKHSFLLFQRGRRGKVTNTQSACASTTFV